MKRFIKEHPFVAGLIGLAFYGVPWLVAVWALLSDEPLFQVLRRNMGPLSFPGAWVTIAIGATGLVLLGGVVFQLSKTAEAYRRRDIVSSLALKRELAVRTLLNRSVTTTADLDQLKQDIDHWQNSVVKQLNDFGNQSDVTYFRVLGTYQPQNLAGWNSDHASEKNMLAERLNRLLEIMRRIERD